MGSSRRRSARTGIRSTSWCVHLHDPEYASFTHVNQLPHHRQLEMQRFFLDYKQLEGKRVEVDAFDGPEQAHAVIEDCRKRYLDKRDGLPGWHP
jgi:inorganic pyrophosphatase